MVSRDDEVFDSLIESLISEYLDFNPLLGTYLGLHEYDPLMPNLSKDRFEYAIKRLEWYLNKFKSIDRERLTGSRKIDYEPIIRGIGEFLILTRDWPTWRMYPIGFDIVGRALFSILIRDHLPMEHRLFSLYSRVKGIEKAIMDSLNNVDEPYTLWLDYTAMSGKGLPHLLNVIKRFGEKFENKELIDACERAVEVITKGLERLKDLRTRAKPGFKPIGMELFKNFYGQDS